MSRGGTKTVVLVYGRRRQQIIDKIEARIMARSAYVTVRTYGLVLGHWPSGPQQEEAFGILETAQSSIVRPKSLEILVVKNTVRLRIVLVGSNRLFLFLDEWRYLDKHIRLEFMKA